MNAYTIPNSYTIKTSAKSDHLLVGKKNKTKFLRIPDIVLHKFIGGLILSMFYLDQHFVYPPSCVISSGSTELCYIYHFILYLQFTTWHDILLFMAGSQKSISFVHIVSIVI